MLYGFRSTVLGPDESVSACSPLARCRRVSGVIADVRPQLRVLPKADSGSGKPSCRDLSDPFIITGQRSDTMPG